MGQMSLKTTPKWVKADLRKAIRLKVAHLPVRPPRRREEAAPAPA